MRLRFALIPSLALFTAAPVYAAEHLMHVGEVLLSKDGDTSIQYIELSDKAAEPFPAAAYIVEVFGADGTSKGTIALDKAKLVSDQATFFIPTAAAATAFGKAADATLTLALETNGTACFGKPGTPNTYIHCLQWGTATAPAGTTGKVETGTSPPDGQSLSLQANGSYAVVAPSPKAANNAPAATADMAGATPSVDMAGSTPGVDMASPSTPTKKDDGGCDVNGGGLASASTMLGLVGAAMLLSRRRARS